MSGSDRPPIERLLIGDTNDPHVAAVVSRLPRTGTVVVDTTTLDRTILELSTNATILKDLAGYQVTLRESGARGWLRRLSPAASDSGIEIGSGQAARLAAQLALLGSLVRDRRVQWLSDPSTVFAAENKITQYQTAGLVGVRVPAWQVARTRDDLRQLGSTLVLKPLGPGNFKSENGDDQVVWATEVTPTSLPSGNLLESPFLAQEKVSARIHLRIVTVRGDAWCARLQADTMPVDWRRDHDSHFGFVSTQDWQHVEHAAVRLAAAMRVGYSSQDWIVDDQSVPHFLDLNPGGQWLFLPAAVGDAVAQGLSDWLMGG